MTQLPLSDPEIDYARRAEGSIYGTGTADLLQAIKDALLAIPGPRPVDPRQARDAIYAALRDAAAAAGMNPDIEVVRREEGAEGRRTYYVAWEAGPYEWAIPASFVVMDATGRLTEPYYSFDLQLYDVE